LETRFLESLLAVAKFGTIAEAARQQGLTAAAVGQRIQTLEVEFGLPLLERVGHRSRPTEACLRLLPHAGFLVEQSQQLIEKADIDGLRGTLRVGVISTLLQDLVPAILRNMAEKLPALRLQIVPGTSKELYSAFSDDVIDAALIVTPTFSIPKGTTSSHLRQEPLVLISAKPLSGPVSQLLKDRPYFRYDPESWGGMIAARYLREMKISVDPFCDLDSLETIAVLVSEGMGVSLVPKWRGLSRFSGIHVSDPCPSQFDRHLCMLTRTKPRRERLMDIFTGIVRSAAELQPG